MGVGVGVVVTAAVAVAGAMTVAVGVGVGVVVTAAVAVAVAVAMTVGVGVGVGVGVAMAAAVGVAVTAVVGVGVAVSETIISERMKVLVFCLDYNHCPEQGRHYRDNHSGCQIRLPIVPLLEPERTQDHRRYEFAGPEQDLHIRESQPQVGAGVRRGRWMWW